MAKVGAMAPHESHASQDAYSCRCHCAWFTASSVTNNGTVHTLVLSTLLVAPSMKTLVVGANAIALWYIAVSKLKEELV